MKPKELIKEAKNIITIYGEDTTASDFAKNVLDYLESSELPDRNKKILNMTHIPDSSGM